MEFKIGIGISVGKRIVGLVIAVLVYVR